MKLVIAVFLAVMLCAGCGKNVAATGTPVPDTTLHKMTVSAFEIVNALDSGEKEFETLYSSGLPGVSDDDYAKTVAQIFLSSQTCAKGYVGQLQTLTTVDDSNKAQVVGWTQTLIACTNNLISSGVAGIKNPDAKQKILALLSPIPAAVNIIANLLGMPTQTASMAACIQRAPSIFTEVNFGPTIRSRTYRSRHPVDREPFRLSGEAQSGRWAFRSGLAQRRSADQRCSNHQDAGFSREAKRSFINPLRESWLFT